MNLPLRSPTAIRHQLRRATADQHTALDDGFGALDLKKRNDYSAFLASQATVLGPLEDWLTRHNIEGVLPDWPRRRRAEALAEDLAGLGAVAELNDVVMGTPSIPAMLGVTYVLEGSRLGARYLSRIVAGGDDATVRRNMRFLSHGAGLPLWPSFLDILESRVAGAEATGEATRGARQTFAHFLAAQRRHARALADEVA